MRILALGSLSVLAACSGADATPMVRVRAADDLVCAESTIRVRRELDGTYSALGCGKHALYRAVCEGTRCAVSRHGESTHAPPAHGLAPEPGTRDFAR